MNNLSQPDPQVSDERVFISARLPKTLDRAVEIEAAHRDCSKQQLIEDALRSFLGGDLK